MNSKNTLITLVTMLVIAGTCFGVYYLFFSTLSVQTFVPENTNTITSVQSEYNSGNLDQAIIKGESLKAVDKNNVSATLGLAATYAEKGSVTFNETTYGEKAIEIASQVLNLNATDEQKSEAYRIIGYANEIMNKFDDARLNYDKAIQLSSSNTEAYSNKGHSYDLQGDRKTALIWYERALAFDPVNEHALLNKARIDMKALKYDASLSGLQKITSLTKNKRTSAEAYQLIGGINILQEKFADAVIALKLSLSFDQSIPQTWITLGEAELRQSFSEDLSEADFTNFLQREHSYINKALALYPHYVAAYYLSYRLANMDEDIGTAGELKRKGLEEIPNDITLGQEEKDNMRALFSVKISNINYK